MVAASKPMPAFNPAKWSACHHLMSMPRSRAARSAPRTEAFGGRRSSQAHVASRGRQGLRLQQACRHCRAGRVGCKPPYRRPSRSLDDQKGEKPRLVHRLDRDTSGFLVVARTRGAAQKLTCSISRTRYQEDLLVVGQRRSAQASGQDFELAGQGADTGWRPYAHCQARRGRRRPRDLYYRVIDTAAQNLAWLEMEPYTGRTHQLRVHALHMGHPIIGDPKYYIDDPNWDFPGGIQKRLHLHARHIDIPHPSGVVSASAHLFRRIWCRRGISSARCCRW